MPAPPRIRRLLRRRRIAELLGRNRLTHAVRRRGIVLVVVLVLVLREGIFHGGGGGERV